MKAVSTQNDTKNLSLTIYNNGFGVVKEERVMELGKDVTQIQYLDVAEKIETNSIIVKGVHIQELNYDYDLVSKEKLLEKYLDRTVCLITGPEKNKKEYRLLSVASGMVLEDTQTKEIVINPYGELVLPSLPDELIVKPALIWKIKQSPTNKVNVSYITKGIEWTANYVINVQQEHLQLSGWVDINNKSGATYENANLKLIAGEVNRVEKGIDYDAKVLYSHAEISEESFEEKSFADYHMYTLQNKTTLKQNQSKQINFIELDHIPYKKYYLADRWNDQPKIMLELDNRKESGLGIPLPEGVIKVYQEDDQDASLEFIGENSISHTPKDEKVCISIGEAFDIVCEGNKIYSKKAGRYEYEQYQYEIRNHKDEPVLMKIPHYMSGHWEMLEQSDSFEKENAHNIVFWVNVEANSNKKVTFEYRIDHGVTIEINKK